jgi:hypothetical protein
MSGKPINSGVSCTEIKITVTPPAFVGASFETVALVPGHKTVVTTLRLGEEGLLDTDEFKLGQDAVNMLLLKLASETESYMRHVCLLSTYRTCYLFN